MRRQAMNYRMAMKVQALTNIMSMMMLVLDLYFYDLLFPNRRMP
jgi:hypothetical protein